MNNVLVFSTSVSSLPEARSLAAVLDRLAGSSRWNFDLTDSDRVLRVTTSVNPGIIIAALHLQGFRCEELADEVPQEVDYTQLMVS